MKFRNLFLPALMAVASVTACSKPEPYGPVPSPSQLEWHDLEYYMFCHFGPNTFTGLEWGLGDENPDVFAPTDLDCDQWARTAVAAGMKGIVITAKHHDGFCLWPSKYSDHTIANSAWRDGKGDILQELREACDRHGLLFGVYISPWDRNHPLYGSEEYNDVFAGTIAEVHQKYGPVFEQWFDGANGGAKIPPYDWDLFHKTVYEHSPNAVIFSDVGPGCRWVGNERGFVGETNWNFLDTEGFTPGAGSPPADTLNMGNRHGSQWVPAECDVSIRKGWFSTPFDENPLKSVDHLMEIWLGSVGRGGNLILNVPPDYTGHIPAADSLRLVEFRAAREAAFGTCLAKVANKSSQAVLKTSAPVNYIVLQEDIQYGQRISAFVVEAKSAEGWKEIASGTTVGHKRILKLDAPCSAGSYRVRVTASDDRPMLKTVELY